MAKRGLQSAMVISEVARALHAAFPPDKANHLLAEVTRAFRGQVYVRFLNVPEGIESPEYGPYDWVQMTYAEALRIPPEGDHLAEYFEGRWYVVALPADGWTDIAVYSKGIDR